jgi:hypothetical protein
MHWLALYRHSCQLGLDRLLSSFEDSNYEQIQRLEEVTRMSRESEQQDPIGGQ